MRTAGDVAPLAIAGSDQPAAADEADEAVHERVLGASSIRRLLRLPPTRTAWC